jgi:hypothetical protein
MSNLPTNSSTDLVTNQFFNSSFVQNVTYNQAVYDQVYGYFYDQTGSADAANTLTQTLITMTNNNRLNPLDVVKDLAKAPDASQLKRLLITFFNASRLPTSKVGYNVNRSVNQWVVRNLSP